MANTTLAYIDIPTWRPIAQCPATFAAGGGLAGDLRNNTDADPCIYSFTGSNTVCKFFPKTNDWLVLANAGMSAFGAGAALVLHPTQGPRGTLTTGATTTKVVLSTALPAAVAINQLANRGDGTGYKIRIVGNASGSSGKTEERWIVANTAGTTPTIWVDSAFSFTPASGDAYEILSGRVFLLGNSTATAGVWKYYDIATNSYSGNLAVTNLPTVGTDSVLFAFSEAWVPSTQAPGAGFLGTLTATATAAGTLTGHSAGGDSGVAANDYRNFQIRITQDTGTPTAAGQRRKITSHTAGTSPVYTLASNWTVTPSSTANYVIEWDDDKVLMFGSGTSTTYTYNISGNTWDTTTFGTAGGNRSSGVMAIGSWGITQDAGKNAKPSMIHVFRGGAATTLDVLDIAGGTNGTWDNAVTTSAGTPAFGGGSCAVYDPITNSGRYAYIVVSGSQRLARYDVANRVLEGWNYLFVTPLGSGVGSKLALCKGYLADNTTKITAVNYLLGASQNVYQAWVTI